MKALVIDGEKLVALLDTKKVKYIRLFLGTSSAANFETMIEVIRDTSNYTEQEIGELTVDEMVELLNEIRAKAVEDAVDPPKAADSSPGETSEATTPQDGVKS